MSGTGLGKVVWSVEVRSGAKVGQGFLFVRFQEGFLHVSCQGCLGNSIGLDLGICDLDTIFFIHLLL